MLITIQRETLHPCAMGEMDIDGNHIGVTLERPWLNNAPHISCIPAGRYRVKFTASAKFGREMLEILNVPGRGGIRIHGANHWSQLEGCVAVAIKKQTPEAIYGSQVSKVEDMVSAALARNEDVWAEFRDPKVAA